MKNWIQKSFALAIVTLGMSILTGCDDKKAVSSKAVAAKTEDKKVAEAGHGWWCDEHGVQEADCSMCSAKVAKDCKAKGDWCDKHERAKSQCFICDPTLKEKFAAQYKAKYGKDAPEPEGQKEEKKDEKKDKK